MLRAIGTVASAREAIPVRVDSVDPISELGLITQLRGRAEVVIAEPGARPAVIIAVMDGTDDDTLQWLRALHAESGAPLVMVIGKVDPHALACLAEAGVRGVLSRNEATADRLVRAVRLAASGEGDLPPALVRQLLDQVGQLNRNLLSPRGLSFAGLSGRERDVLRLMADGMSTREVAAELAYSERTIKCVVQDIMIRLNARNRTHAVACAVRNGWI
jgi:DNA-binding NarL/FixJ family response regulator